MIFIISIETNWLKVGYMSVVRLSDIGRKVCYVNHRTIPFSALWETRVQSKWNRHLVIRPSIVHPILCYHQTLDASTGD